MANLIFLMILFCLPSVSYSGCQNCSIVAIPSSITHPIVYDLNVPIDEQVITIDCHVNGTLTIQEDPNLPLPKGIKVKPEKISTTLNNATVISFIGTPKQATGTVPIKTKILMTQSGEEFPFTCSADFYIKVIDTHTTPNAVRNPTVSQKSLSKDKCSNKIKWRAAKHGNVASTFKIFKDKNLNKLVATIKNKGAPTFKYIDKHCNPGTCNKYYIVAVGNDGTYSKAKKTKLSEICP